MATPAQSFANQANAKLSTGPITPDGKARASQNSTTFGLFAVSSFIRADEREIYDAFRAEWAARLIPDGPFEEALVAELVQAAWRLRRCTLLETTTLLDTAEPEELSQMQGSIDRARVSAQRAMLRIMNELRRVQTERRLRTVVPYGHHAAAAFGAASIKDFDEFMASLAERYPPDALRQSPAFDVTNEDVTNEFAERSQSRPAQQPDSADSAERSQFGTSAIPRSAPCPCGSGEKYKRCCGKNAPPVLSRAA